MELRIASDRDLIICYKSLQKQNEDCEKLRAQLKELEEAALPIARLLVPHPGGPKIAPLVDLLTPKFGTRRSLNCGPSLVKKFVRKKEGFSRKIRQKSSRSAVGFCSARNLFALILSDYMMTWPEQKGRMDG
jgi:hypothetical protein